MKKGRPGLPVLALRPVSSQEGNPSPCWPFRESHCSIWGKMKRKKETHILPFADGSLKIPTRLVTLMTEMSPLSPCSTHLLPLVRDSRQHGQAGLPPAVHTGRCRQTVCPGEAWAPGSDWGRRGGWEADLGPPDVSFPLAERKQPPHPRAPLCPCGCL